MSTRRCGPRLYLGRDIEFDQASQGDFLAGHGKLLITRTFFIQIVEGFVGTPENWNLGLLESLD